MKPFIEDMFKAIDGKNYDAMGGFFHPDISYERPGFPNIEGFSGIMDFYKNRRLIREGTHHIDCVVASEDRAVSIGCFKGILKDGSVAEERFADAYKIQDGRIIHRTTYFFRKAI